MALYWILLGLSAAAGIPMCGLCEKKEGKAPLIYCIVIGVALTVISSVRLGVGYDYNLYATWYYELNFISLDGIGGLSQEKGFMYLLKLLNIAFVDYPAAFVLISLMIYPPLMLYIYKRSDNCWLSVAAFLGMGLFFNSMNFMRQFIAAIICAFAFIYAEKGSLWRFSAAVLFAAAFHRSALVVLPCFALAYIGWNYITLAAAAVISVVVFMLAEPLIRLATHFFYSGYTLDSIHMKGLPIRYTVMFGVLFLTAFLLRNRMQGEKKRINIVLWCCFLSFFFELIGTRFGIISRLGLLFFIPAVCLGVPMSAAAMTGLFKKHPRTGKAVAAAAVLLAMSGCYGLLIYHNYNGVVPYDTVFSELALI